jgi:hypothetical protein
LQERVLGVDFISLLHIHQNRLASPSSDIARKSIDDGGPPYQDARRA